MPERLDQVNHVCVGVSSVTEVSGLTVDSERGRRLRLAHHVLRHAGVGAHVGRGQATDLQGVVLADLVSGSKRGVHIGREVRYSYTHDTVHSPSRPTRTTRVI